MRRRLNRSERYSLIAWCDSFNALPRARDMAVRLGISVNTVFRYAHERRRLLEARTRNAEFGNCRRKGHAIHAQVTP